MFASQDTAHAGAPRKRRVAIVVPALATRGGLASVALFLHRVVLASSRYEPHLISLAMSLADENSVRLLAPGTWLRGIRATRQKLGDIPYIHVGSVAAEIEPYRYRPRRTLTDLLDTFDLVQLVAGTPALAHVARDVRRPVALQCATMVKVERRALLEGRSLATVWRRLMTTLVGRMDESGLHHVDLVLVENAWMRERVARAIGPGRVRFTPPGVDTGIFHADAEDERSGVLAVGRLDDPRKNVAMLLEAFALARPRVAADTRLVLAGERPPDQDVIALGRKLGIADAIDIRLSLSLEELAALYRRAAVFALSSDEEGLGIVVLEAMASGTPVVCTRCGGPETSVLDEKTGFLVPIGDVTAFADRLATLLNDGDLRRRMGAAARAHVAQTFSLEHTGQSFISAYDELLAEQPRERHAAVGAPGP